MPKQILAAFKKHYGEWAESGRDCNTFAAGWLEGCDTERARCAEIARLFTYALSPGPERRAAQEMLRAILSD